MMPSQGTVKGQGTSWSLQQKLGEGDAGEVYLVTSVRDGRQAILKRPRASAFHAEILRQASQIASEGRVLAALKGFRVRLEHSYLTVPQLLDQAKPDQELTSEYFIVIEKAQGIDLDLLVRMQHASLEDLEQRRPLLSEREYHFLEHVQAQQKAPERILLKCLEAVIVLFEEIHHYPLELDGMEKVGILWNDVKAEHVFWDPQNQLCTIIDWGNAQFLEMDGATRDRLHSAADDYLQFMDSLGNFIRNARPDLAEGLEWPAGPHRPELCFPAVRAMCAKVEKLLAEREEAVSRLREREAALLGVPKPSMEHIRKLDRLHQQLCAAGEYPAAEEAGELAERLAKDLAVGSKLAEFARLASWASRLPLADRRQWQLWAALSQVGLNQGDQGERGFLTAIRACMHGNPGDILWDLLQPAPDAGLPLWYPALSRHIRSMQLDLEAGAFAPLDAVLAFTAALEASLKPGAAAAGEHPAYFEQTHEFIGPNERSRKLLEWLECLQNEIIPRWQQLEPDPPQAGLAYGDVRQLIQEMETTFPDAALALHRTIYQPDAQIQIVLDAWSRKDFDFALRALRRMLVWDPERLRVLHAGSLINETQGWLLKLARGPQPGETPQDFTTRHEVFARELRSRVGPAPWLERLLAAFRSLRQGISCASVVSGDIDILLELPWMKIFLTAPPKEKSPTEQEFLQSNFPTVYNLERMPKNNLAEMVFKGCQETTYGQEGDIVLGEALDLWRPEAQGSSARVFQGFVRTGEDSIKQRAIKIMRPNQRDYALPLFEEEVRILRIMQGCPGITPLLEFGFLLPQGEPAHEDGFQASGLRQGEAIRMGWDHADTYLAEIHERVQAGWLPYLVMEKKHPETNLLSLCDGGYTQGRLLPVKMGLLIAIQICDILAYAHRNRVLYRDHKILHYYWQPVYNGVFVIDWNVAKLYDRDLTDSEKDFDLVQFGARALHHILAGRPAPGALPLGPTRPEEIEQASNHYNVAWSYDDQRLGDQVKEVVERTLSGAYSRVETLQADLIQVFYHTPDE